MITIHLATWLVAHWGIIESVFHRPRRCVPALPDPLLRYATCARLR